MPLIEFIMRSNRDLLPVPLTSALADEPMLVIGSKFACIVPLLVCLSPNDECLTCPVPFPWSYARLVAGGGGGDICLLACSYGYILFCGGGDMCLWSVLALL